MSSRSALRLATLAVAFAVALPVRAQSGLEREVLVRAPSRAVVTVDGRPATPGEPVVTTRGAVDVVVTLANGRRLEQEVALPPGFRATVEVGAARIPPVRAAVAVLLPGYVQAADRPAVSIVGWATMAASAFAGYTATNAYDEAIEEYEAAVRVYEWSTEESQVIEARQALEASHQTLRRAVTVERVAAVAGVGAVVYLIVDGIRNHVTEQELRVTGTTTMAVVPTFSDGPGFAVRLRF